jgi:hypothetical protein
MKINNIRFIYLMTSLVMLLLHALPGFSMESRYGIEYQATIMFPNSLDSNETTPDFPVIREGPITLRVDLIEINPSSMKILNTKTFQAESGHLLEHQIFFKSSISSKGFFSSLKILPEMLKKQNIQLDLRFRVYPAMDDFKQVVVVTRNQESAILEFLENTRTQTKIAFRITPTNINIASAAADEQPHKPITEEVFVRWWVVPVFAVDKNGTSIKDLKKKHLEIYLDKRPIDSFNLYKKEFAAVETVKPKPGTPSQEIFQPKKMVFIVFDNFLTSQLMLSKSKSIAKQLISESENNNHYVLMSLEYGAGFKYIAGPTDKKEDILGAIKKIKPAAKRFRKRHPSQVDVTNQESKWQDPQDLEYFTGTKDEIDEHRQALEKMDPMYKGHGKHEKIKDRITNPQNTRKGSEYTYQQGPAQFRQYFNETYLGQLFLRGLRTLDAALGTMENSSRLVYLFSTGIAEKNLYRKISKNISIDAFHYHQLKRIGEVFNKNGSMLFVVNPEGTRLPAADLNSGETSLRLLAESSGGRYYEGEKDKISKQVINMDRAFYEIAFPDITNGKKDIHDIKITAKRPGIKIYTVKKLARGRNYGEMKPFEKEILVLSAIEGGYLAKIKLELKEIQLKNIKETKESMVYRLEVPEPIKQREWDVYKVWESTTIPGVKMDKETLLPAASYFEITMKKRKNYKNYIVIVHPKTARAYIAR